MAVFFVILIYCIVSTICLAFLCLGLYQKNTNAICKSKRRLDGKTVLVTGGTSGMGLEIATDLANRGARVIVACPFEEEGVTGRELIIKETGNKNVVYEKLDLSSFASVKEFAKKILETEGRLDVLVNNAGIGGNLSQCLSGDGINLVMHVNYLGTVLLTLLLLPLLNKSSTKKEPSRIVNTASFVHFVGKVAPEQWRMAGHPYVYYSSSKLCISLFTRELARKMKNFDVIVNVVDPGLAATPMFKNAGKCQLILTFLVRVCLKTAWEGAQTAIFAAVDEDANLNGKYFCNCKIASRQRAPALYEDDEKCRLLWEKTMEFLNIKESSLFG